VRESNEQYRAGNRSALKGVDTWPYIRPSGYSNQQQASAEQIKAAQEAQQKAAEAERARQQRQRQAEQAQREREANQRAQQDRTSQRD
jgi:hypothetical protein